MTITDGAEEHYDAIVLGAGISGLVSAAILLEQGAGRVLVVDEYPQAGGNHIDVAVGPYTFDVGSFIFQDDSPLLRWFPELMQSYVSIRPSWSRINPQRFVTQYPFSIWNDLLRAGPIEVSRILASVALARIRNRPQQNARDFAEHWLGPRLARSGLLDYMERFCGISADRIDLQFAEARMAWIAEYAKIRTHVERFRRQIFSKPQQASHPQNRQLARPRAGFQTLYSPVVDRLGSLGAEFRFGLRPDRLERDDAALVLQLSGSQIRADRVISTIPIDIALQLTGIEAEPLPTVTLVSLFYSFAGERGFSTSILYNFSSTAAWKRLTMYSDFYGTEDGRTYFAVEVIERAGGTTIEEAADEFRTHTAENGLLTGDLHLEGGHMLRQAYPIYSAGSGERSQVYRQALKDFGVESFGRQGGFNYQPTARVSTRSAEEALGATSVDMAPMPSPDPGPEVIDGPSNNKSF